MSNIGYKVQEVREIERKVVWGLVSKDIFEKLTLVGQVGLTFDGKWEGQSESMGSGVMFSAGGVSRLYRGSFLSLCAFGLFSYFDETYSGYGATTGPNISSRIKLKIKESHIGGATEIKMGEQFYFYLSVAYIPSSSGVAQVVTNQNGIKSTTNGVAKRSQALYYSTGVNYLTAKVVFSPQIVLGSERSLVLSATSGL